jgi:hypothetical protein
MTDAAFGMLNGVICSVSNKAAENSPVLMYVLVRAAFHYLRYAECWQKKTACGPAEYLQKLRGHTAANPYFQQFSL